MKTYDFAFGLGRACACTQTMRRAGLQYLSLPWDWVAYDGNAPDLLNRVDVTCNDFKGFLEMDDLEYRGPNAGPGKDNYLNRKSGMFFLHDFPKGVPLAESYPAVKAKYDRRIARFHQLIAKARSPILVVAMDSPLSKPTPLDDCRKARERLAERFPGAKFELLNITLDSGRSIADRIDETVEDGLYHIAFDFKDHRPEAHDYDVDQRAVASLLKARFAVRDYRTKDERRAMRERTRLVKMREAGASNRLQYFLIRMKRRLEKMFR